LATARAEFGRAFQRAGGEDQEAARGFAQAKRLAREQRCRDAAFEGLSCHSLCWFPGTPPWSNFGHANAAGGEAMSALCESPADGIAEAANGTC
jgi:hypothetical protein